MRSGVISTHHPPHIIRHTSATHPPTRLVMAAAAPPPPASDLRARFRRHLQQKTPLTAEEALDLEIGAFNWTLAKANELKIPCTWTNPRFCQLYVSKTRSITSNVDSSVYVGNMRLINRVREGEFKPHDIALMQPDNVFPERWRHVVEMKVRRDEYICNARPAAMTDQFKCSRCKKRECSYMELQTRSCDEPASIFVQCLACGNRWRMG